jgi:hypothetical protein
MCHLSLKESFLKETLNERVHETIPAAVHFHIPDYDDE